MYLWGLLLKRSAFSNLDMTWAYCEILTGHYLYQRSNRKAKSVFPQWKHLQTSNNLPLVVMLARRWGNEKGWWGKSPVSGSDGSMKHCCFVSLFSVSNIPQRLSALTIKNLDSLELWIHIYIFVARSDVISCEVSQSVHSIKLYCSFIILVLVQKTVKHLLGRHF